MCSDASFSEYNHQAGSPGNYPTRQVSDVFMFDRIPEQNYRVALLDKGPETKIPDIVFGTFIQTVGKLGLEHLIRVSLF